MRTSTKFLGAIAIAGLVAAGGSAFTGTGLTSTAGDAAFVGGTVSQNISGAELTSTNYSYVAGGSNSAISSVAMTFADNAATYGKAVSAVLSGGSGTNLTSCTGTLSALNHVITCSSDAAGYTGATSLAVTVAS